MSEYVVSFPGLGLEFTLDRVAFSIGNLHIYWYGLLIATGLLLAVAWCFHHAIEFGIDSDRLLDVVCIGTVMAIISARVYYVVMSPYGYDSIWDMIDIRQGGIAIYGAIIGAVVFGGLAAKWRGLPVLATFDLVSIGFLIGQTMGRWGNFVNQEAFGYNTNLPWGMYSIKTQQYLESSVVTLPAGMTVDPTMPVHPTFLYESLWCFAGFVMLALYFKKRKFNGDVALRYAIWYGLGRFWIEGLRTDSLLLVPSIGLRASQLVAAVTVVVCLVLELYLSRKARAAQPLAVKLALNSENFSAMKRQSKTLADLALADDSLPVGASRAQYLAATGVYNEKAAAILNPAAAKKKAEDEAGQDAEPKTEESASENNPEE